MAVRLQEQDLRGKIALVTGATKGIGRAIVLDLATRGASILGTYTHPSSSRLFDTLTEDIFNIYSSSSESCESSLKHPQIVGIAADITSPNSPLVILDALRQHFDSRVDIVVFNAAVMGLAKMGEGGLTEAFIGQALSGNIQFPIMLMEGLVTGSYIGRDGRVVAISSDGVRSKRPPGGSVYGATKAALECIMRSWADELGTRPGMEGTTFNSVSVGFTKTEAYHRIPPEIREKITKADAADVAVGNRIGEVEDVADVVGLLVGDKARWISGSVVDASGGRVKIM
ncbi:short-chain dehydrogenase [Aaosphaeria arxii CBS 175.79]|uniref:Short-chain dehydrogenase n=1 Tax=Aaosphaeria arxii CBS 175.79 TaxID=1450172 RepID=A0A6A5XLF6_9PLEO|nr:short-chain dehydrogenase [Aaosphaeria arxii CBS 175.79]KAF2013773.1 short-chain dehydrogenase [Aaosphaeria arxii CBS 175.79]